MLSILSLKGEGRGANRDAEGEILRQPVSLKNSDKFSRLNLVIKG